MDLPAKATIRLSIQWQEAHEPEEVGRLIDFKMGANLEVIDPASLPEQPISPNRLVVAAIGLVAGLIAGALWIRAMPATVPRPA